METRQLAKAISDFSMLPAFILRLDDGSYEVVSSGSVKDEVFSIINTDLLLKIAIENKRLPGFRYIHPTELSLLFFNLRENVTLVFGPFYIRIRESDLLIRALESAYSTSLSAQKRTMILDSIRVKDSFFIDAWRDIMCALTGVPSFELEEKREVIENDGVEEVRSYEITASRMIQGDVSLGYGFENKIRHAVMEGDKDKLYELLMPQKNLSEYASEVGANIKHRFEAKKYGSWKSAQIILNTIFRIAAENAGLPPVYLHSISDGIAKIIEEEDGQNAIILEKMINSYCDAINRMGIKNRSYRVTRVQKYIISHLTEELSLETLATIADTSQQHLSRLFRKECGVTITQYIRAQRINEAKLLIRTTDAPIVEIAESLGFSSQNYFCNVFKAETGMTPSMYKSKSELTRNAE